MFNSLKKSLGYEPLDRLFLGNYFFKSLFTGKKNNVYDIELIDLQKSESWVYLNTYATNSMKIEIVTLEGRVFLDLREHHFTQNNRRVFKLADIKQQNYNMLLIQEEERATLIYDDREEYKGTVFLKDFQTHKRYQDKKRLENLEKFKNNKMNSSLVAPKYEETIVIKEIKAMLNDRTYIRDILEKEFNNDIRRMSLSAPVNEIHIEKYSKYLDKISNTEIAQKILYDTATSEEISKLKITNHEIEEFKRLNRKLNNYKLFDGASNPNGVYLIDLFRKLNKILDE